MAHPYSPSELRLGPSPKPHAGQEGELEEAVYKSELALANVRGNAVLGDPKTDRAMVGKFL
ncbi:MAG: hypothetical protein AAGB19_22305 [Cyanobacteria bacterium P01_F01_bin.3]